MGLEATLFDDDAMRDFIVKGYCVLKTDMPPEFHQGIFEKTKKILAEEGNPGNNILPRMPEVQQIFEQPAVQGALTSLLGPSYVMHVHRFAHPNGPNGAGGGWHKDSYWGYSKVRDHHPRWIMAMYYPQDVPFELGPTGAIPGSQYFETRVPSFPHDAAESLDSEGIGLPVVGEAGSVILIHFDLWHRAFPNPSDHHRFMFKFQFTRLDEPSEANWNSKLNDIPLNDLEGNPRSPIWKQMWRWLSGNSDWATKGDASALKIALHDSSEEVRLNAAYTLGGLCEEGRAVLAEGLREEREEVRRASCYGLALTGKAGAEDLILALQSPNDRTRGYATYALGDQGARRSEAVPALVALCEDPSEFADRACDVRGQRRE